MGIGAGSQNLPLMGIRILEIAPPSAGAVTRYFAELGADVILVPQAEVVADPMADLVSNTGKRIMRLDLDQSQDIQRLSDLAADADILVDTRFDGSATGPLDDSWLANIRARNPRLVATRLTPFGMDAGPQQSWQVTTSTLDALCGVAARSGFPGSPPLLPPAEVSLQCGYVQAAWVILVAYYNRLRTAQGDALDLSLLESTAFSMDSGYAIGGSATVGVPASQMPRGRPETRHMYPFIRCKDGYVRICVLAPRQWQNMFRWMGEPAQYAGPEYNLLLTRFASPTLLPDIAALFADKTRRQVEQEAEHFGVPIAPVLTLAEAMEMEQFAARGALTQVTDDQGRNVRVPNGIMEIDGERAGVPGAAHIVDRDADWLDPVRFDPAPDAAPPERPLSGITILDMGVIVAGAEQSRLLADQGALTLKLENKDFPDGGRQNMGDAGPISINFAMGHRNKKSVALNLRGAQGKSLFADMAKRSDIILSNFKPGTLTSLGLDHAALSRVNPAIIMGDSSAYGPTGPLSGRPGYGPLVRASSGLTDLWVYPDRPNEYSDGATVYPDHVSGRIMAIGILALLIRRMRDKVGGTVSMAQAEVINIHLADRIAALSVGEDRPARPDAPWGVYPCAGDDEWCAITVRSDADWRALCQAIGRDDLLARPDLATAKGRLLASAEINQAVTAWTQDQSPQDCTETLQAASVPAAPMLRVVDMPDFAAFHQRETFKLARHPLIPDPFFMENSLGRSERLPDPECAPAPLVGEDTLWAMSDFLVLDNAAIAQLRANGAIELTESDADVPAL